MPRQIFLELDRDTYERIIQNKNDEKGIYDKQKLFNGLKKGDSAILQCGINKLEAHIEDVIIYNTIEDFMKGEQLEMFKLDCNNPLEMLSIIDQMQMASKKMRIYRVGYYPYGDNPPTPPEKKRKLKFKDLADKYYEDKSTGYDDPYPEQDPFDDYDDYEDYP